MAATGDSGFSIDEAPPDDRAGRSRFTCVSTHRRAIREHDALVERIVETEKPAYVTYEVVYA